jgi:hypothetical protein
MASPAVAPWEREHYSFTGPGVAISCKVAYDSAEGCYVAAPEQEGGRHVGKSMQSAHDAALACFQAWMTGRNSYWQQSPEQGGERA